MMSLLQGHTTEFNMFGTFLMADILVGVVFGLKYDSPSSWKNTAMDTEIVRLEEISSKYWQDRQMLAIWQMDDISSGRRRRNRSHCLGLSSIFGLTGSFEICGNKSVVRSAQETPEKMPASMV